MSQLRRQILNENIITTKTNAQAPTDSALEDGVQEWAETIMCMCMSRHKNIRQNHDKGHTKCIKSESIEMFWNDNKK
jgi:hypothetical protein